MREINDYANRLRIFRKSEGYGTVDFAEKLSVDRTVLSRYETGHLQMPLKFIRELHDVYNLSFHWFFTGKGSKKHVSEKPNLLTDISELMTNQELLYNQVESLKYELLKLHREFHATKNASSINFQTDQAADKSIK